MSIIGIGETGEWKLLRVIRDSAPVAADTLITALAGEVSRPHIYLLLNKLEENGLIRARYEFPEQRRLGPPYRVFELTRKGQKVVRLVQCLERVLQER